MRRRRRLWAAFAAALVLLSGIVARRLVQRRRLNGMARLADAIPIHSKWWRDQRKEQGELLYVAIGDSAAQGIGASLPSRGYVGLIYRHIRTATNRTVRVINLSQSGGRLREVLEAQLPVLTELKPDIVTVAIGANDVPGFDEERFRREAEALLGALPDHAIIADVPSFYFGQAERNARIAASIVRELAHRHGLPLAPLYAATRRQTGVKTALRDVAADFFHPNDRGYRVWASAFLPAVDRRLRMLEGPAGGVGR